MFLSIAGGLEIDDISVSLPIQHILWLYKHKVDLTHVLIYFLWENSYLLFTHMYSKEQNF